MSQFDNPFAAPLTESPAAAPVGVFEGHSTEAEAMRRTYLKHEASVRSIGTLYYLGAIFMGLAGVGILVVAAIRPAGGAPGPAELGVIAGIGVLYLLLSAVSYFLGRGLRALSPNARIPVTFFAVLGLLSIPIGTLINGYILYLLFSAKGKVVFSPEYRDVVRRTPHIQYKTSLLTWIVLIVVILLVIGLIAAAVAGA